MFLANDMVLLVILVFKQVSHKHLFINQFLNGSGQTAGFAL
jgi:hypothetical protein